MKSHLLDGPKLKSKRPINRYNTTMYKRQTSNVYDLDNQSENRNVPVRRGSMPIAFKEPSSNNKDVIVRRRSTITNKKIVSKERVVPQFLLELKEEDKSDNIYQKRNNINKNNRLNANIKKISPKRKKYKRKMKRNKRVNPLYKIYKKTFLYSMIGTLFHKSDIYIDNDNIRESVIEIGLTNSHLIKLKLKFKQIDVDGNKNIDVDEFFEALGEKPTPFTKAIFNKLDIDSSGEIDYEEYVGILVTYCIFDRDEILQFCFDCFDDDNSGALDEREFHELCQVVNNASPLFPGNFKEALSQFDQNGDGLIDFGEFQELSKRFPQVLFPAFKLQDEMQRQSLGTKTWLTIHQRLAKKNRLIMYKRKFGNLPSLSFSDKYSCIKSDTYYIHQEIEMNDNENDNDNENEYEN